MVVALVMVADLAGITAAQTVFPALVVAVANVALVTVAVTAAGLAADVDCGCCKLVVPLRHTVTAYSHAVSLVAGLMVDWPVGFQQEKAYVACDFD